jgi:tRNA A37 threonylcarbamoyladenosine dehydratase
MDSDLDSRVVVTGAGGFVGGWRVAELLASGHRHVRAVDGSWASITNASMQSASWRSTKPMSAAS